MGTDRAKAEKSPPDRRADARLELEVEVGLETEHNFYTGLTQDISTGGIFVATGILHNVGERIAVKFTLPGYKETISAETEVRWQRDPSRMRTDAPEGIGLRFIALSPDAKAAIDQFLERRDSLFFDDDITD